MDRDSSRASWVAVAVGVAWIVTGCSEQNFSKIVDLRDVLCPDVDCTKVFTLDEIAVNALRGCYAYDPDDGWPPTTPGEIAGCEDEPICEIRVEPPLTFQMSDRGCCVDDFPGFPDQEPPSQCLVESEPEPVDICTPPLSIATTAWDELGEEMVEAVQLDCGIDLVPDPTPDCAPPEAPRAWGELCPA